MRIPTVRTIAAASLLSAGLGAWPGCGGQDTTTTETPAPGAPTTVSPAAPTTVEKLEKGAGDTLQKVEEKLEAAGEKVGEVSVKAVDATGKGIEKLGQKLEGPAKDAVRENIGDKAAGVVEGAGQGLDKAGQKIQDSVKKPQ